MKNASIKGNISTKTIKIDGGASGARHGADSGSDSSNPDHVIEAKTFE